MAIEIIPIKTVTLVKGQHYIRTTLTLPLSDNRILRRIDVVKRPPPFLTPRQISEEIAAGTPALELGEVEEVLTAVRTTLGK